MAFIQKVQQSFKKLKQKYANKMMSSKCLCKEQSDCCKEKDKQHIETK